MGLEAQKLLYDIEQAIELIVRFVRGKQFDDYMPTAHCSVQPWSDSSRSSEKR
jgi:hypothetical protein